MFMNLKTRWILPGTILLALLAPSLVVAEDYPLRQITMASLLSSTRASRLEKLVLAS